MSADRKPLTAAELQSRIVITVAEFSAIFGADERTTRRALRDGQIQGLQVGDTWRIPVAPLLRRLGLEPSTEADLETAKPRPTTAAFATTHAT